MSPEELALDDYVRRVGSTVASHAHRHLPYFHLLPNRSTINAFSLPGGPVYVGEGLLDLMTSEDEPASVLGHEIEHIDHYHCAERAQVEAKATQSETRGDWRSGADSAQCVEGRL